MDLREQDTCKCQLALILGDIFSLMSYQPSVISPQKKSYLSSNPMFPLFLQLPEKGPRPKWTIFIYLFYIVFEHCSYRQLQFYVCYIGICFTRNLL